MSHTEKIMSRRLVQAHIQADRVTITLLRNGRVSDGAGGWISTASVPQTPFDAAIIPAKRRLAEFMINTELGDLPKYPFILLAPHDTDIRREDTFYWQGDLFEVQSVYIKTDVSTTAQIDYFGGDNNGES